MHKREDELEGEWGGAYGKVWRGKGREKCNYIIISSMEK